MGRFAMLIRLFSIVSGVIGIVNLSGIPDGAEPVAGVVLLGIAVGAWILANRLMWQAYHGVVAKYRRGEQLSQDELDLLRSRPPSE